MNSREHVFISAMAYHFQGKSFAFPYADMSYYTPMEPQM